MYLGERGVAHNIPSRSEGGAHTRCVRIGWGTVYEAAREPAPFWVSRLAYQAVSSDDCGVPVTGAHKGSLSGGAGPTASARMSGPLSSNPPHKTLHVDGKLCVEFKCMSLTVSLVLGNLSLGLDVR